MTWPNTLDAGANVPVHLWVPPSPSRSIPARDPRDPRGVLLMNEAFSPLIDGVINVVENLYQSLSQRGIYTHVVTSSAPGYKDTHERITRLPSLDLPMSRPYRTPLKCTPEKYLPADLASKIDIVHLHSGFDGARSVMKWARRNNKHVVFTMHTKYADKIKNSFGGDHKLSRYIYNRIVEVINASDLITCPGELFAKQLPGDGVDTSRLRVVRNGVAEWPETTREQRERMMLTDPLAKRIFDARDAGKAVLLFVGQHIREKNPHVLMQSLAHLKAADKGFLCLFVGGGDMTAALQKQASKLGLTDDVAFVGRVHDRARLSMLFALSDLMTFPSTFETSGLVVMEAAQHGLPTLGILGSSGVSEVVHDNDNGFLAALDPAPYAVRIQEALADRPKLASVRMRAQQSIARDKDAMVEDFLGIYREVMAQKGASPELQHAGFFF